MHVYQLQVKLIALRDLPANMIQSKLAYFIDSALLKDADWAEFHKKYSHKNYCFDGLYRELSDVKENELHTLQIRTVNLELATYLLDVLAVHRTDDFQGLKTDITEPRNGLIEVLHTVTPVVWMTEQGYWRGHCSFDEFKQVLCDRLIRVYNSLYKDQIPTNYEFFDMLEFYNDKPIATHYKNVTFLGDKITLYIKPDKISQRLARLAMGIGLFEKTSRGYGYVIAHWNT